MGALADTSNVGCEAASALAVGAFNRLYQRFAHAIRLCHGTGYSSLHIALALEILYWYSLQATVIHSGGTLVVTEL